MEPVKNGKNNLPLFFEKDTDKIYDIAKTPKSEDGYQIIRNGKGKEGSRSLAWRSEATKTHQLFAGDKAHDGEGKACGSSEQKFLQQKSVNPFGS